MTVIYDGTPLTKQCQILNIVPKVYVLQNQQRKKKISPSSSHTGYLNSFVVFWMVRY